MHKNFDEWNEKKKKINEQTPTSFARIRDIWWCSLGLNVGSEEDGKNELFERPVLVIKKFNKEILRILPLTSKAKDDQHHFKIVYANRNGSVILSQLKTISSKRLSRKLYRIDRPQFNEIIQTLRKNLV